MVTDTKKSQSNRRYAIAIGVGLGLFPIHNQWLANVTSINGNATLFLPVFGSIIWVLATLFYLRDNYKELEWGDRRVLIFLLVIAGAIGLSGLMSDTIGGKIAPLLMGLSMCSLYLVARKIGKDMFVPLAVGAVIASFGVIISQMMTTGKVTGGLVFEGNYDIVVGYVLLGVGLFSNKVYQWRLACLALVAVLLTGSPEGMFAIVILGGVIIYRKDWSRKLAVAIIPAIVIISGLFYMGYGQTLYSYVAKVVTITPTLNDEKVSWLTTINDRYREIAKSALGYRIAVAGQALSDIQPLGTGYNITGFTQSIVHNVPLIIVQQLGYPGIVAALAWLWVSLWCLYRTKWKYVWVLVLSLSVFDHYIWTQLAPWWWAMVGVTTAGGINSDLLFSKTKEQIAREALVKKVERMRKIYNDQPLDKQADKV